MITIQKNLQIKVKDAPTFEELEEQIFDRLQRAGRDLLAASCQEIEARALERLGERVRLDRRRSRNLLTRFGWMSLERWSVQDRASGAYRSPLDETLKLPPRQHTSGWLVRLALVLASCMPYRQATQLLGELTRGIHLDHRTLWRLMRRSGATSARSVEAPERPRQTA